MAVRFIPWTFGGGGGAPVGAEYLVMTANASLTNERVATAGAGNIATIEGYISPSANGTVIARFASEVASSAITAKAGSFVEFMQVA